MNSLNSQNVKLRTYNVILIIALSLIFTAGFLLTFLGLFLSPEQTNVLIILGFIFISIGIIECILIIRKAMKRIDLLFDKVDIPIQSSNKRGFLHIIRPEVSISESQRIDSPKTTLNPVISTQNNSNDKYEIINKDSGDLERNIIKISIEEALQKILDRYNDPKVSKMFTNWQNTLMMSFPDLKKNYLFKINNDQGIKLEEGYEDDAAVQVNLDSETFIKMMTKQINPIKAYSSGELEVKGKMKNLLKLRKLMF
jgi:putative sterol carrier protein